MDLQGPLDDFLSRTREIANIVAAIEAVSKNAVVLTTARPGVDLAEINLKTVSTTNAMAIVLLASSFEEFVREEIGQCAEYMSAKYSGLRIDVQHAVRNYYWSVCLDKLSLNRSILTKAKPRLPDVVAVGRVRGLLESARGFVVDNDPAHIDRNALYHHSKNFRPHVVDELANRVGVANLMDGAADSSRLKAYFGVTSKADSAKKLKIKLEEFYERRNEIVHSLSAVTGYAVDVVLDYINLFDMTAEGIKSSLIKATSRW